FSRIAVARCHQGWSTGRRGSVASVTEKNLCRSGASRQELWSGHRFGHRNATAALGRKLVADPALDLDCAPDGGARHHPLIQRVQPPKTLRIRPWCIDHAPIEAK